MDNLSKMMIILFNFMMILGFVIAIESMIEFNLVIGLIILITVVCLTFIFNYNEVIKHQRFE